MCREVEENSRNKLYLTYVIIEPQDTFCGVCPRACVCFVSSIMFDEISIQ